ncbi:hypothetical protein BJX70DRAFT_341512 [Aspergillus crustosus]
MAQQFDVAVHGRKRPAKGELDDQPLAKKFGRLQIGSLSMLHLPDVPEKPAKPVPRLSEANDPMVLDDTKSRVYIYDLDRELTENKAVDCPLIILPGLEESLSMSKILVPLGKANRQCSEIVLYREPESLSISKENDQVRRALMETRERARLGQWIPQRNIRDTDRPLLTEHSLKAVIGQHEDVVEDKMDIDIEN